MNERKIKKLQEQFGYDLHQSLINSGEAWKLGGKMTRECKELIESGACFLPHSSHRINVFLTVPSRYEVGKGDPGSIERSKKYWADEWNISQEIGKQVMNIVM